jgi:hypothetical protein
MTVLAAAPAAKPAPARLVFVYNAEAGIAAGIMDSVHKIVSPGTYPCSLCAVTYGLVGMRRAWRAWLAALPLPAVFHHRPDFRAAWPQAADWPLPLVALAGAGELRLLIAADRLAALDTIPALAAAIETALAEAAAAAPP